jgi:DNA invertase Pin-like site-specific DNA recombinase
VTAKLERRRILERTARGRADAKANGVVARAWDDA